MKKPAKEVITEATAPAPVGWPSSLAIRRGPSPEVAARLVRCAGLSRRRAHRASTRDLNEHRAVESVLAWPTRGIPLAALARRAPASASAIEEELAALFFIRHARASETPMPPMETDVQTRGDRAVEAVALVLPLRRRPESQHPFISIGRLDGNDLALPDASVSKFHAYVKQRENGFLLQDARSRNGTSIDGAPVPARGEGPPLALRDGQHIKLGAVELTCINAASLLRLLRTRSAAF